ncbi:IS5 family transposase [Ensifer sp. 22564]|uniref:IS5 family transposase n=1 Tax=Ensifer sp. 22564 TaxID=3453943 RepID=UPI003F87042D
MRPTRPSCGRNDLFRDRLDAIINLKHPLVKLSRVMDWARFDEAFGGFYRPVGRPAKPTRLMVGLHYLKHVYDLPDEETVERWVENPYWQYFCGFEFFQTEMPSDASTMTRWRKRIGPQGLSEMLKVSVEAALDTGTKPSSLERITVYATVQPKAIAYLTDGRLYLKAILSLVRRARRLGIDLRQSHTRLAKAAAVRVGRYANARQFRRMRRELEKLRTYLGCVYRDLSRKISGNVDIESRLARLLGLVERQLVQKPKDKDKLYSLHAPEVVCISKGKARTPYEFGAKVGIATTNREGLVLASVAFTTNPYDGHTLERTVSQAVETGGIEPDRIYVDKGFRGHDYKGSATVFIAGQKRGLTRTIRRELKRRSAIEATIGHMKTDGRLDRNHLLGHDGDAANALLVAAAHNLRLILKVIALWRAYILAIINTANAKAAKSDTWSTPTKLANSNA